MNCRQCGSPLTPAAGQTFAGGNLTALGQQPNATQAGIVCSHCGFVNDAPKSERTGRIVGVLVVAYLLVVCLAVWTIFRVARSGNAGGLFRHRAAPQASGFRPGGVPAPHMDGSFPCVRAVVNGAKTTADFGKCKTPTENDGRVDEFDTDLRDGAFVLRETDLEINDVFDVPLTRSYRSNDWVHRNHVHAFGKNTNHPFDIAPLGSRNPYTYQMLVLEDGEFYYFDRISKGTGYADAEYIQTENTGRFFKATQQWNGKGWTMKLTDGTEFLFPDSYSATNLAQGGPTEIRDGKGNRLELLRDGQRNLQQIKTPHGHWMRFSYDGQSRIVRAETDAGDWARYSYNADGMLESVALRNGHEEHYSYDGIRMTDVKDEKGRVLVHNEYGTLLQLQTFGNGERYFYIYDWRQWKHYPDTVRVVLPNGSEQTLKVDDAVSVYLKGSR